MSNTVPPETNPDDVQYLGRLGITRSCIEAVARLLQCGEQINMARLLTSGEIHAFLIQNQQGELFAVKGGFRSGYYGEGPKGLAVVLHLLDRHNIEVEEFEVKSKLIDRLNSASLSRSDLEKLVLASPVRPLRWHEYIYQQAEGGRLNDDLSRYYPLELPFGVIDARIFDLALRFEGDPDGAVVGAYRRLEDIVRQRTGIGGFGARLFSKAFVDHGAPLGWNAPDLNESVGRGNLFKAIYTAFRNARAHRELEPRRASDLREFLLINELFLLESEAVGDGDTADN